MATSVLKLFKSHLKKTFFASSLFAMSFANAQTGNAISGYAYLGQYNGHHYYLSDNGALWPVAKANALGLGGYLATLTTAEENQQVTNWVIGKTGTATYNGGGSYQNINHPWIGYTDDIGQGTTEKNWVWANGENCSNYTNWDLETPEPNNFPAGTTENYATLLIFAGSKLGKWNDWFNDWENRYIVEFGPNPCTPPPTGDQGCSHGYWKNHAESWQVYTTGQTLESVFDVPNSLGMDDFTLMQALNFSGGSGVTGAARNLFKQAVGALLNAAHSEVNYPLTTAQVIAQVNTALASNNRNTMLALTDILDGYNNLHGASICSDGGTLSRFGNSIMEEKMVTAEKNFTINGYPNPSRTSFNIQIDGLSTEKISIRVTDLTGRLIEARNNIGATQVLKIGSTYKAGMYYIEVTQGAAKRQLKMVKQ
jgi:hypothetical protein